jgi:DNA-binding PadR family transcriptional regulator
MGLINMVARILGISPVRTRNEKRIKILSILDRGERSGRRTRQCLDQCGYRMSGPDFYGITARMEDDGLIEGWYVSRMIDGHKTMQRFHRITDKGRKALEESKSTHV